MEYKEVKANAEEVAEGKFNLLVALYSHLDNDERKYSVEQALAELDEALCWRDGIDGDEYSYNHLQTDYIPLPLQTAGIEVESENEMVVTLTYAPYAECKLENANANGEINSLSTRHWDITEYEKAGYTQNEMQVVKRIYKLSWYND
jgi:hypothetical protein